MVTMSKGGNYVAGPSNSSILRSLIGNTWGYMKLPVLNYRKYEETKDINASTERLVNVSETFTWLDSYDDFSKDFDSKEAFSVGI